MPAAGSGAKAAGRSAVAAPAGPEPTMTASRRSTNAPLAPRDGPRHCPRPCPLTAPVAAGGTQQPHLPSLPRPGRPRPDAPGNAVFQTLRCRPVTGRATAHQSPLRHAGAGRLIVSLRRAGPAHAHGAGACAVHARPPRVAARRVRRAGLASPAERRRAAAAVTGGEVRLVARRGAHVDAGEQAGTARRTVSLRGAPAMAAHADAPGLVRRIADRAIATAPAGALHRAGLAGAFAAAAAVAD